MGAVQTLKNYQQMANLMGDELRKDPQPDGDDIGSLGSFDVVQRTGKLRMLFHLAFSPQYLRIEGQAEIRNPLLVGHYPFLRAWY